MENVGQNTQNKTKDSAVEDDGKIVYIPNFLEQDEAFELYNYLKDNVGWEFGEYKIMGKNIKTPRLLSSMKDDIFDIDKVMKGTTYNTSNWNDKVKALKIKIENKLNITIVYAQLNYYRNGKDYIGFHSDRELTEGGVIASISLGAERKFSLRKKNSLTQYNFQLENASLIIMDYDSANKNYKHSLIKNPKINEGRINLTFRNK